MCCVRYNIDAKFLPVDETTEIITRCHLIQNTVTFAEMLSSKPVATKGTQFHHTKPFDNQKCEIDALKIL